MRPCRVLRPRCGRGRARNAARELTLQREVDGLRHAVGELFSVDGLIGNSARMCEARRALHEAAAKSAPLLLTGQPDGTGLRDPADAIGRTSREHLPSSPVGSLE